MDQERLKQLIELERVHGLSDEIIMQRVAARLWQEKQHGSKNTFDQSAKAWMLKSNLMKDLMQQSSGFAADPLQRALGPELFSKLKPVGFADKMRKVVLLQVSSSSLAHELSFRKIEILKRLREIQFFGQAIDLRFILVS